MRNLIQFFSSLLFVVFCNSISAQIPPTLEWQKSFGGSLDDAANCVKPTPDGGFITVGGSSSNDGNITGNHGQKDFCLLKLDNSGNLVWGHSYGGTGNDEAFSVVSTMDGGYVVVGKTNSHNGDVTGYHGGSDVWLIKTNDQGILQWQKSYGGSMNDAATGMQLTPDGGFVIAGLSYSNDGDVSGNHGMGDAWIIKADQNGNLQWQKTFGGSQFDVAADVQNTSDGGYIAAGYSLSNDGNLIENHGQEDFLIFKLDVNGNLQWERTMGGTGGDCANAVHQTPDGGYLLCGLSHSKDLDVVGTHGAHDMWVVKTDPYGTPQWTRCLGGSLGDNGVDIKQSTDGTIIALGYTASSDGNVTGNHGLDDIWLTELDTLGNLLWQKTLGGSGEEIPFNLQITSGGQYLVAARSSSNDGDITGNHGGFDYWVAKLDPVCNYVFYADADTDGYGDRNTQSVACSAPSGYVTDSTDCNDTNPSIHPGMDEVCNGLDDNCNGITDDGLTFVTYFTDGDSDGFGAFSDPGTLMCNNPGVGYSTSNSDCDDSNPVINPGVTEVCNNLIDDNCNGQIDENCSTFVYYADLDSDSFGNAGSPIASYDPSPPAGYVTDNTDCDDNNPSVHTPSLFYIDADEDGFGSLETVMLCASPPLLSYSFSNTDCNDSDPSIHPGETEVCNGLDDDCNGIADDGLTFITYFTDADFDGFGSSSSSGTSMCSNPGAGYSITNTDCDDSKSAINPGAAEICNNIDDNCNNQIDEGAVSATIIPAGTASFCSGSNIILSANTGTGLIYQWKKNGTNISGATTSNYTAKAAGSYTVKVSSGSCSATSAATNVSVNPLPVSTVIPAGTISVCPGISLTMNANTGIGLMYQWQKGGVNVSGATGSSYMTSMTGSYKVIVTDNNGCSKTSPITTINNYTKPSVKITTTGNFCSSGSITLSAKTGSGYSYQWFKDNVAISSATGISYIATQAGTYYYQATTSDGCSANSPNKVVSSCRLDNENDSPSVLSVYPNPTHGAFTIELQLPDKLSAAAQIELIDMFGNVVLAEDAAINEGTLMHTVTIQDEFHSALYIVKIVVGEQVFFQRIIFQQ